MSDALIQHVQQRLRDEAEPEKAPAMAAYMKTDMPFYGVQARARHAIGRDVARRFAGISEADYVAAIEGLWAAPHREDKYMAIEVAGLFPEHRVPPRLPLYRRLVAEGAWWDLVDATVSAAISPVLRAHREAVRPEMDRWIASDDLWVRRAAMLCQLGHREVASQPQLFAYALRLAAEKEFFIRKAIGWALRDYSYAAPDAVAAFVEDHEEVFSGLTVREALKHVRRLDARGMR